MFGRSKKDTNNNEDDEVRYDDIPAGVPDNVSAEDSLRAMTLGDDETRDENEYPDSPSTPSGSEKKKGMHDCARRHQRVRLHEYRLCPSAVKRLPLHANAKGHT
jgi:hypothetical protein